MDAQAQSSFVRSRLPWVVAALSLIVYLATLNRWISLTSLSAATQFLDPELVPPLSGGSLLYLLTLPLHLLPSSLQLIAFNVLTTGFAALTLALLARSVALLPHDRTREERHRPMTEHALLEIRLAWLAPILAAFILGLQLSFWEHATAGTGHMLNLLMFAYVIRCLLEYRVDPRESWLTRMALVYGLATANNYAMIAYFPLALTAIIWVRGRAFFQGGFILRMTLWGLAGLSLYLVAPAVISLQDSGTGFWVGLHQELTLQYRVLRSVNRLFVFLASLTSIVPLFLIAIRWPSTFGDTSAFGNLLINYAFRVVYGVFAAFILWMMLGAEFAPRALFEAQLAKMAQSFAAPPFLSFYYLAALVLGYILGYFLLVFGQGEHQRHRRKQARPHPLSLGIAALPVLASTTVLGLLFVQNLPSIRSNNGILLKTFALRSVESLPSEPAVVVSDNPGMLQLVKALLLQQDKSDQCLLVLSAYLEYPSYQRTLNATAPHLWPDVFTGTNITTKIAKEGLMLEMSEVANQTPTYYLHPSFGYFFERVYLEPHGLNFSLKTYTTNMVLPPELNPEAAQRTLQYAEDLWRDIEPLTRTAKQGSSDARLVAQWYALTLNYWGVALQRSANSPLESSALLFSRAKQLNPDNIAADINLKFNQSLQAGRRDSPAAGKSLEQLFGLKYRSWDALVQLNGPIDDPVVCLNLGRSMSAQSLVRQAITEFRRSIALSPADQQQTTRLLLAKAYSSANLFEQVFDTLREIRQAGVDHPIDPEDELLLYELEAFAMKARDQNTTAAIAFLQEKLAQHRNATSLVYALAMLYLEANQPDQAIDLFNRQLAEIPPNPEDPSKLESLLLNKATLCMQLARYEEAGQALRQILSRSPDHAEALLNQGALYIRTERFDQAIAPLKRLLELQPDYLAAQLNLAIALLKSGKLDEAQAQYHLLLDNLPQLYVAHFGLADIAWQQKDYATAAEHYEAYLKTAPPNTDEAREVAARLESIKSGNL